MSLAERHPPKRMKALAQKTPAGPATHSSVALVSPRATPQGEGSRGVKGKESAKASDEDLSKRAPVSPLPIQELCCIHSWAGGKQYQSPSMVGLSGATGLLPRSSSGGCSTRS